MKNFYLKSLIVPALLCSQFASAAVVLLQDKRSISATDTPNTTAVVSKPPVNFAHWTTQTATSGTATYIQDSTATSTLFSGSGKSYSFSCIDCNPQYTPIYHYAQSIFEVTFRVDQAQTVQLTAQLAGGGYGQDVFLGIYGGNTYQENMWEVTDGIYPDPNVYHGGVNIAKSILLGPGVYTFRADATNYGGYSGTYSSSSGNYSFQAVFPAEVPVPAAGWLLISALGSLGAARHVRRQK